MFVILKKNTKIKMIRRRTVTPDDVNLLPDVTNCSLWGSVRLTYTIMAFIEMVLQLCMRNTINFVILCMVKPMPSSLKEILVKKAIYDGEYNKTCYQSTNDSNSELRTGTLEWTREQEFQLQGTFYYGYLIALPISAYLSDKIGGQFFFVNSVPSQAIAFMLIPVCAKYNFWAAIIARTLQGFLAGTSNPSLYQLFSVWAHPTERTAFISFAYGGYAFGTMIIMPITGFFCNHFGWEYAFYFVGIFSVIFGCLARILIFSSLEDHPRITDEEYIYLKKAATNTSKKQHIVPVKKILTSITVYAFAITHLFYTYSNMLFTLMMPRLLKEGLGFSIEQASYYSSAVFLGGLLSKTVSVTSCIWIERRDYINITIFRRILFAICNIITIIILIAIICLKCENRLIIVLLTLIMGFFVDIGFAAGYWPSVLYFAPTYSGLISGLSNCLGTMSGFIVPILVNKIVKSGIKYEWNIIIETCIVCYAISAIIYGAFGSSKMMSWDPKYIEKTGRVQNSYDETKT